MKKVYCKDFNIVSRRVGSRLANGPEYGYVVIFKDGTQYGNTFYTKSDATKYISKLVKMANALIERRCANECI